MGVCSNIYVSGLSIADCVFSGRRVGKSLGDNMNLNFASVWEMIADLIPDNDALICGEEVVNWQIMTYAQVN